MVIGPFGEFGGDALKRVVVEGKTAYERAPIPHRLTVERGALDRVQTFAPVTSTHVQVYWQ